MERVHGAGVQGVFAGDARDLRAGQGLSVRKRFVLKEYDLIATTTFGLEAVLNRELDRLGCTEHTTANGRTYFRGDIRTVARANLWLRTADRILLNLGKFKALTFEELFQGVKAVPWKRRRATAKGRATDSLTQRLLSKLLTLDCDLWLRSNFKGLLMDWWSASKPGVMRDMRERAAI